MTAPRTADFEKLGLFYLGRDASGSGDLVLYDAKDLTTHAVIIGMTGSGKTGLGIGLIEEAAIDRIPVIAIDPKGDLGNLLLTFPQLRAEDFLPWVDPRAAAGAGMTPPEWAQAQAKLWRDGLAQWGQDGARIARLRESADIALYTPGSSAGRPLAALASFAAPSGAVRADPDLYRDRIQATASGLLALLSIEGDPFASREHVLIATLLQHYWDAGRDIDLETLIGAVQRPPVARIGVMEIDAFYPAQERFALAMKLNNLLASPGFAVWRTGEPIDAGRLLHTESGKPRVSILSIAHLSDAERMFFVTLLLSEIVGWMRAQPGTPTLRALLYMDEIVGYMPPVANPPSKPLFMTLLKQARAYGLGVVVATQNPVDLDYKALANAGTWFVGRLQTERDRQRVLDALEGSAGGLGDSRQQVEATLGGLGKRRFLLHNVHENEPVVFETRWALSYLSGPLTREQIRALSPAATAALEAASTAAAAPASTGVASAPTLDVPPVLPPGIEQYWLPVAESAADAGVVYAPCALGAARIVYSSSRHRVQAERLVLHAAPIGDSGRVEWDAAEALDVAPESLESAGRPGARYVATPTGLGDAKQVATWRQAFERWLRHGVPLVLYHSPTLKLISDAGENERDFRIRLQHHASAQRDLAVEKLRAKYAPKKAALEDRLRRARLVVEREREQAKGSQLDAAVSLGTAVLGTLLGRRRIGAGGVTRAGGALRSAGRAARQRSDVARAEETVETLEAQLRELDAECEREIAALAESFDAQAEQLEEIAITPKAGGVHVRFVALGWRPVPAVRSDTPGR